jgi:hypothetical protein
MLKQPKTSTELARLAVNDPLAFVEHRAAVGKPELFKFDSVGDSLAGMITEIERIEGTYGPYREISVIRRDQTECRFEAFGAVLSSRCERAKVGDAIAVRRGEDGYSPEYKKPYPVFEVTIVSPEQDQRGALDPAPISAARALSRSPEVDEILADHGGDSEDDDGLDF